MHNTGVNWSVLATQTDFEHARVRTTSFRLRILAYVTTVPGKRDHLSNFFKIELLLQQGRVGFELQNALHI